MTARAPLPVPDRGSPALHWRKRARTQIDDEFGLGPGDQHRRAREIPPVELPHARQMGHRLTGLAARQQIGKAPGLFGA